MQQLEYVDFEVLAKKGQRVSMHALRNGETVEILKYRTNLGLLLSFLEWLRGADEESQKAIEDLKAEVLRAQAEVLKIRVKGLIPDVLDCGETLSTDFDRVADKLRHVGYLVFPQGIRYIESQLLAY